MNEGGKSLEAAPRPTNPSPGAPFRSGRGPSRLLFQRLIGQWRLKRHQCLVIALAQCVKIIFVASFAIAVAAL
jgi:hypothetical protein